MEIFKGKIKLAKKNLNYFGKIHPVIFLSIFLLLLGLEACSIAVSKLYCLSRRCLRRSRRLTCRVNWLIQYWICESKRRVSCFKSPTPMMHRIFNKKIFFYQQVWMHYFFRVICVYEKLDSPLICTWFDKNDAGRESIVDCKRPCLDSIGDLWQVPR